MPRISAALRIWMSAGLVSAVLLSGCQPSDGATTPPPSISPFLPTVQTASPTSTSPSATVTPTLSPSPTLVVTARPTTPEETAALAAEAEHVYREMRRLRDEYESQGGAATLPPSFKPFVAGSYADALASSLKFTYNKEERFEGRTLVSRQGIFLDTQGQNSLIGVEFCLDESQRTVFDKDGRRYPISHRTISRAEFSRGPDEKLRITFNISEDAASCDS